MKPKVLITDYVHDILPDTLIKNGYEVHYDQSVNNDILETIIHLYEGVVINSKILLDKNKIDKAVRLKWVARLGSGLEIIDTGYCRKKKIKVINSPEGNCHAVAEHEIGMLLCLFNNINKGDRDVRNFIWAREKNRGTELRGKTLGIIGLGHTGSALAEKMSSWGLNIISYDKYRERFPKRLRLVKKVGIDELKRVADIISFHIPLTEETTYWLNEDFLKDCKDGVIISNTSRGKICNTYDLISALKSGKAGGACLDVFENEKSETYSDSEKFMYGELFELENVVLSPHIAGWTKESLFLISSILLKKLNLTINIE
ncbi:MAG: hydroxyacid dehydrogenase [Saprospiraceae bacterium]|nr:hydroxyacid dehydrogenase [Saprospiraceae bacterium]